jgi:alkanesulfonate monooxygenase SsuD/methylene tetrahydromethanopterin reductase-like flavin-dependent oxidoreductase (luciferase family)
VKGQPGIRPMSDIRLVGTPAQVTDGLRAILARGARRLTVNFADAPRPDGTQLFAARVLPHLS